MKKIHASTEAETDHFVPTTDQVAALLAKIDELETQFLEESYRRDEELKKGQDEAQRRIADLESQLAGYRDGSTVSRLRKDLDIVKESLDKKHDLVATRNAEITELKAKISALNSAKANLEAKLKAREDRGADRTREVRDLNLAVQRKGEEILKLNEQLAALPAKHAEESKRLIELEQQIVAQDEVVKKLKADKQGLIKLSEEAIEVITKLEADAQTAEANLAKAAESNQALEARVQGLATEKSELSASCIKLQSEKDGLAARLQAKVQELHSLQEHVQAKAGRIAELEAELADRPKVLRETANRLLAGLGDLTIKLSSSLKPADVQPSVAGIVLAYTTDQIGQHQARLDACLSDATNALGTLSDQLATFSSAQRSAKQKLDSADRLGDERKPEFEQELRSVEGRIRELTPLKEKLQTISAVIRESLRCLNRYTQLQERLQDLSTEERALAEVMAMPIPTDQVRQVLANLIKSEEATTLPSAGIRQSGVQAIPRPRPLDDLQNIADQHGLSLQGAIVLLLCELLPDPNRTGIKMKSMSQLLTGAEKSGIARHLEFSVNPEDYGNGLNGSTDFRGTPTQAGVFELYAHYYTVQHSVSRRSNGLPWHERIASLVSEEMRKAFSALLQEEVKSKPEKAPRPSRKKPTPLAS